MPACPLRSRSDALAAMCVAVLVALAGCQANTVTPPGGPAPDSLGLRPGEITTFAGTGIGGYNGRGKPRLRSWLYDPTDVYVAPSGDIYIADWNNFRIREVLAGTDSLHAVGTGDVLPATDPDLLNHPSGAFVTADGTVLIVAWHNHQIRRQAGPASLAFLWGTILGYGGDGGLAAEAQFDYPSSAAWGADSTLYVSDQGNRRIRAILHDHVPLEMRTIVTMAGSGDAGFTGDGGPAIGAGFDCPEGPAIYPSFRLTTSTDGRFLYVCDSYHQRLRRIDLADPQKTIATVAGSGSSGAHDGAYAGDGGPATSARLNLPADVETDADGSVYICDAGNHSIRKVDALGIITTVAGNGRAGFTGDGGPAVSAELNNPSGIGLDRVRRLLYIADQGNHRIRVMRLAQ